MSKKIAWMMVSCLIIVAMVLGSCATEEEEASVAEEEETDEEVTEEEETAELVPTDPTMVYDTLGNLVEEPQYGGTLNLEINTAVFLDLSPGRGVLSGHQAKNKVYDFLLQADWTKGPMGTNEAYFDNRTRPEGFTGSVAESWVLRFLIIVIF